MEMLSGGAVGRMLEGHEVDSAVFQYLGSKKISGQGGSDRYRMQISDGIHSHTFAMLATQLNHLIPDGTLDNFCIFRANKMIANSVNGQSDRKVLIILELTVLKKGTEVNKKLGSPVVWSEANKNLAPNMDGSSTKANGNSNGTNVISNNSSLGSNKESSTPFAKHPPQSRISGTFNNSGSGSNNFGNQGQLNKMQNTQRVAPINAECIPIKDVTPYNQRVSIKARVVNKTPIKHWSNSRGEGKLFSMDLLDESAEIRCTLFKEQVDNHYDTIQVGEVFIISKFQVKTANKNFTSIPHDYEISFGNETELFQCANDSGVPVITFSFVKIADIENVDENAYVDLIGICKTRSELQTIYRKSDNKEMIKREMSLVDQSGKEINVTLWDILAKEFEDDSHPVIAIKGARVSNFNGKSLSVGQSSVFQVNPDINEAHVLRGWYDNEGSYIQIQSLSVNSRASGGAAIWKTLKEANLLEAGNEPEKGDYFTAKVTIVAIRRENACYTACPGPNCNKKVIDNQNGLYRCEKCGKDYDSFKWRFMLNVNFGDNFDNVWATCFNEVAETILKDNSDKLGDMHKDSSGEFDAVVKDALFNNYIVKFRSKTETYNNEARKKVVVVDLQPMNYAEYAKKLATEIREQM